MNSLDSLLHLCRIILLSECMKYVVEGRGLAGDHFDVELIILVLLLRLIEGVAARQIQDFSVA